MNDSIQKRVLSNYSIGFISFIISFLQAIITVPILLKYWGNETYGIWLSLFAGFTILQSFDYGHQSFIGNLLNVEYHIDKEKFSEYLGSSLSMAYFLGVIQLVITILLITSGYLNNFLGIKDHIISYRSVVISILSLIVMWAVTGSIGGILVKILIPAGYMAQSLIWGIIFKLFQFLSLILVAISGGQILQASIVYSIVQTVLAFFLLYYIKNKMPEFYPWWKSINWKLGFVNLKKSSVLTINNILRQLTTNGLVLFITNIFSATLVPAFTTIRTLTNTATVFTNLFITSIQPDLMKYHAKKETGKLLVTLNANWFFSGLIVNIGLVLVIPFASVIFKVWTKGLISFDSKLFICLVASVSFINFGAGLYNYIYGINNLRAVSTIAITRVIILFVISYFLSNIMGLSGIGVAILISEIIASMVLPLIFVQKILKAFDENINNRTSLVAAMPPLIILILTIISLSMTKFSLYIWGITVLIIISLYIFNWTILDKGVKNRFKKMISDLF